MGLLRIDAPQIPTPAAQHAAVQRVLYKAAMLDGVPNFAVYFGYSNVSWTRRSMC